MKNRDLSMDCARAICMLYIVGFWHLFDYTGKNIVNPLTSQITYGVLATFTFISGYFLGRKKIRNLKSVFLFWWKRLISFYPLFVLASILLWRTGYIWETRQLVLTVMGLSCLIPPAPFTAWYLCMLMVFYFITPIINLLSERWIKVIAIVFVEFVFILGRTTIDSRLYFYWPFYSIGILLGVLELTHKAHYKAMTLAAGIFILADMNVGNEIERLSFICSGCVVVFAINLGKVLRNTFFSKLLCHISYASMCAYLFHRPVYFYLARIKGTFTIWEAYLIALPLLIIICWEIQRLYDRLIMHKEYK